MFTINGPCPAQSWTVVKAEDSPIGAVRQVEGDPTGKVYRQKNIETYTVQSLGQEMRVVEFSWRTRWNGTTEVFAQYNYCKPKGNK